MVVIPVCPRPPNTAPDGESFKTSGFMDVPLVFLVQSFPLPDLSFSKSSDFPSEDNNHWCQNQGLLWCYQAW